MLSTPIEFDPASLDRLPLVDFTERINNNLSQSHIMLRWLLFTIFHTTVLICPPFPPSPYLNAKVASRTTPISWQINYVRRNRTLAINSRSYLHSMVSMVRFTLLWSWTERRPGKFNQKSITGTITFTL